ncbi:MAG: YaiI/YqxD family protein [Gammaproteobacteria bacterium]|nr:YaiI/YqxD family protein [Gammaproteobacteria bacterium]MBL4728785.1 YaiI/YqxD family protein [Gammaproteobacteria bacterium]
MTIWVDADACPKPIKAILFRAAERTGVPLCLIANQAMQTPPFKNITAIQVAQGFDVADNEIVRRVQQDDLVITSDIPLADELISKGAQVLSPRGEEFSANSIKAKLNMRDFMDTMRSSGIHTGGPAQMSETDKRKFANALDRYLARYSKE